MKYRFHPKDGDIIKCICQISNVSEQDLDVADFEPDYDLEILKNFRKQLLSLKDKRFFIVGDYDCDGICATTIMMKLLSDLKIKANYYIPSRSKEGYGLNDKIVDTAVENGFDVLLCVDNGIVAADQLNKARLAGLLTLVIDHHEYKQLPDCDGILHPDLFPEKYHDMCAAGICALLANSFKEDSLNFAYGGLATLADMVSVFDYNRYLMKKMLTVLKNEDIYPIKFLLGADVSYENLSYNVIPKINAVSRLDEYMNVNYVVRYLLDNSNGCQKYLNKIETINTQRKELSKAMAGKAKRLMDERHDLVIVRSDSFKEGLCGLIANRLMNECGKAVLVLSESDEELKGSGRAPKGADLYAYLHDISEVFTSFGGHQQAVGLSLLKKDYDVLINYVEENSFVYAENEKDVLLLDQDDLDFELLEQLEKLKPFGSDFIEPSLGIKDVRYTKKFKIKGLYPKFSLSDKLEAICFDPLKADVKFDTMIGHLKKDEYHSCRLSFLIEDLIEF